MFLNVIWVDFSYLFLLIWLRNPNYICNQILPNPGHVAIQQTSEICTHWQLTQKGWTTKGNSAHWLLTWPVTLTLTCLSDLSISLPQLGWHHSIRFSMKRHHRLPMPQCHSWITLVSQYLKSRLFIGQRFSVLHVTGPSWSDYVRVCVSRNTHILQISTNRLDTKMDYFLQRSYFAFLQRAWQSKCAVLGFEP